MCTIACEPVDGAEEAGRIGAVTVAAQALVERAFCLSSIHLTSGRPFFSKQPASQRPFATLPLRRPFLHRPDHP